MVQDSVGPAIAEAGQHVGRALQATSTPQERVMQTLAIRKLLAEVEETDARRDYYLSEAARNAQSVNASHGLPGVTEVIEGQRPLVTGEDALNFGWEDGVFEPRRFRGLVKPEIPGSPVASGGDISVVSGAPPTWREFELAEGRRIVLPHASSPAEALEGISESLPLMWAVYRENVARYGESWGDWFFHRYISNAPGDARSWWDRKRAEWKRNSRVRGQFE